MAAAAFSFGEVVCLAGEAASDVLENPTESERWEEFLRESNSPIVVVSGTRRRWPPAERRRCALAIQFLVPRGG